EYRIDNTQATERGFISAGVLKNHRQDSTYYSYQTFDVYRENKTYRRNWKGNENVWYEWEMFINHNKEVHEFYTMGVIAVESVLSNNSPITSFPIDSVTEHRVDANASQDKGFPDGEGGFLTTHRHLSPYYGYQTFDVYKKNKRYRRNWNQ